MRRWKKYYVIVLAAIGALFGLWTVYRTQQSLPVQPIMFMPAQSPYEHAIAGTGIIEASSGNISIGSPFDLIITKVFVVEGQMVKAGDPLFKLDDRTLQAQLKSAQADRNLSLATFADKKRQFSFYKKLHDSRAVSKQLYQQARYAVLEARRSVLVSQASIKVAQTNIDRSTVRAPIDGEIFQVNVHVGEIAPVVSIDSIQSTSMSANQGALIFMGRTSPLCIRIDIDENDAWRFIQDSAATAFFRGNSAINFPINFVRVEPYIVPKSSFTGATYERVDTRVLQVLYSFEKGDLPIYAGQVLDVFIETKPRDELWPK